MIDKQHSTIGVGKILVCNWGYSMSFADFYEVVKESPKTILARRIRSKITNTIGYSTGYSVPDIKNKTDEIIRIYKRENKPNGLSLITRRYGLRKYYELWDEKPEYFNHND